MDTMTLQILQNSPQHLGYDLLQQTTILPLNKTFENLHKFFWLKNPENGESQNFKGFPSLLQLRGCCGSLLATAGLILKKEVQMTFE